MRAVLDGDTQRDHKLDGHDVPTLLVVDGVDSVRTQVRAYLARHGYVSEEASSIAGAAQEIRNEPPDITLVDCLIDTPDAIVALQRVDERVPMIVMVPQNAVELGLQAVRAGAAHYVTKPLDLAALLVVVRNLVDAQRTRRRSVAINVLENRRGIDPFVGESAAIQALSREAHAILDSHAPILIQGETGTGKGVLANWLHNHGPRAEEAFVDINCAGLSREFVESELFGHTRGAFTGANAAKLGLLDVAHRGTAFLDEIGEIDLLLQPRLLKVLEEKKFRRLGEVRDHAVDIRLIAATNRDLARRSRDGTFRADLYYRINTVALTMPSLRQRREDIPILARQIANGLGHDIDFTPDAVRAMQAYDWPGNVRELRNVVERAILISNRAARITHNDLRFDSTPTDDGLVVERQPAPCAEDDVDESEICTLVEAERRHIERVLRFEKGSVERAAVRLGVSRSTLYQKLRRFNIPTKPPATKHGA